MTHNEGADNQMRSVRSPLANLRDLGGLPVATGIIKPTVLFRSDDLTLSPIEELHELVNLGLNIVLDLRSPSEQVLRPHMDLVGLGVSLHSLSFIEDAIDPETAAARMTEIATPSDLGRWYAQMAEDAAAIIVRGLDIIVGSEGSTLFHCAAGKDRTGVFSAAILSVLEAEEDVIIEDYAQTDLVIQQVLSRLSPVSLDDSDSDRPQWDPAMFSSDSPLLRAQADTARAMLSELSSRHGGMSNLLHNAGMAPHMRERLEAKLVL
ncbi:MAG: tyrosine-protein phosphatase [Actinomycetota bacterium]